MNILLPINLQPTGGSSTFARTLHVSLSAQGDKVFFQLQPDYDLLLASASVPLALLWHARRRRRPIIHRLDGAYYPTTIAGWRYPLYNAPLKFTHWAATFTVYQSRFARDCTARFIGPPPAGRHAIIYNGVNTDLFSPRPLIRTPSLNKPLRLITAQQFRRRDQIEPLIRAWTAYRQRYGPAEFYIAGDFTGAVKQLPARLAQIPQLHLLGPLDHQNLAPQLAQADVFMYCHPNPACPNNVLEALAVGLPVVGMADGAMPELVQHHRQGFLVTVSGSGYWRRRRFAPADFADGLDYAQQHRQRLGLAARQRACAQFSLPQMLAQYRQVFTTVLTN